VGLRERLENGPETNTKDEAALGLAIHWNQQALSQPRSTSVLLDLLKHADIP